MPLTSRFVDIHAIAATERLWELLDLVALLELGLWPFTYSTPGL